MEPVLINGVRILPFASCDELLDYISTRDGILVAINAGKIHHATDETRKIIQEGIGYIDGAGALKAVQKHGAKQAVRIPGCDLWLEIIKRNYRAGKKFYFVGGKQEVIDDVVARLRRDFEGINIVGYRNGYIQTAAEKEILLQSVEETKPDFVFVAMGSPKQELLMQEMQCRHKAIYQGLGGSFDLYTGRAKRAPKWVQKHNLEGFYRMSTNLNRTRIRRYWEDVKFIVGVYSGKY